MRPRISFYKKNSAWLKIKNFIQFAIVSVVVSIGRLGTQSQVTGPKKALKVIKNFSKIKKFIYTKIK